MTRNLLRAVSFIVALLATPSLGAIITVDTVIGPDSEYTGQFIDLREGPNGSPHVTVLPGAVMDEVQVHDESQLVVLGGSLRQVVASDDSFVDVRDGTFQAGVGAHRRSRLLFGGGVAGVAFASSNSFPAERPRLVIAGGTILGDVYTTYTGEIVIRGGTVGRLTFQPENSGSVVNISGGSLERISASYDAVIHYSGGELRDMSMLARDDSIIHIYGTGLHYAPGGLFGTLRDGTVLDAYFVDEVRPAQINIHNLPEPTGVVLAAVAVGSAWSAKLATAALR